MKRNILYVFIFLFSGYLLADNIIFKDGRSVENVKVRVKREFAEVLYKNGKQHILKKSEIKSIKLRPVTWEVKAGNQSSSVIRKNLEFEMTKLEQQRELNFSIPQKVVEERKRNDFLMKERIRLQYTEGYLTYAGGQSIYTEIMVKNNDRFYVRNEFGLLYFTFGDFGDELIIETDNGKERIEPAKMLAVKEGIYKKDYIYLISGEKFRGQIVKNLGEHLLISTDKGEIKIIASEILYPKVPKELFFNNKVNINEGESGQFLFDNGQTIHGKLVKLSKAFLIIETEYGQIEMDRKNLVSVTNEESAK